VDKNEFIENGVQITTLAKLNAQTGVEMEALTAASIAALTIYDMCKALDRFIKINTLALALAIRTVLPLVDTSTILASPLLFTWVNLLITSSH
jgi:hypothetical protein